MSIPKNIHQIYLPNWNELPDKYVPNVKSIIEKNLNWKHFRWDDSSIRNLLRSMGPQYLQKYNDFKLLHQRVDFARYAILYNLGGASVDTDVVAFKSFDETPYLNEKDFIVSYNSANKLESYIKSGLPFTINNATILVKKNNPLLKNLLNQILTESCEIGQSDYSCIQQTTGPAAFTEYLNNYKDQITILDNKYFEPCSGQDPYCEIPQESLVNHKHDATWVNPFYKSLSRLYYSAKQYKGLLLTGLAIIIGIILIPKKS